MTYQSCARLSTLAILLALMAFPAASAQSKVVSVTGLIYDELTREPIDGAEVKFLAEETNPNISKSSRGGSYLVTSLKPGKTYTVRIEKPNYFQTEYTYTAPNTDRYAEISRDFLIKPMRVGAKLPLPVSPFDLKKSKLRIGSEQMLTQLANLLIINPNVKVEVRCFPDESKSGATNRALTQKRCEAVKTYLVNRGIKSDRIEMQANENIDPLYPLPVRKQAKGKRYTGKTYIVVTGA